MAKRDTDWFSAKKWGAMSHYLFSRNKDESEEDAIARFNAQVDAFDVEGLAKQLHTAGAGYYIFTIGQNTGYFCAPNKTYEELTGLTGKRLSRRDLVGDLADALAKYDIALIMYTPSGAPSNDPPARRALDWEWGYGETWEPGEMKPFESSRLSSFQTKWEAILTEWSLRWGKKVSGWWVDGCYFMNAMYHHEDEPNMESFCRALRAGNPDSLLAFNCGVNAPVKLDTGYDDYTAGEINRCFPVTTTRFLGGAQYHILTYLASNWGGGEKLLDNDFIYGYTKQLNQFGAVITWDTPIQKSGLLQQPFYEQLCYLGQKLAEGKERI